MWPFSVSATWAPFGVLSRVSMRMCLLHNMQLCPDIDDSTFTRYGSRSLATVIFRAPPSIPWLSRFCTISSPLGGYLNTRRNASGSVFPLLVSLCLVPVITTVPSTEYTQVWCPGTVHGYIRSERPACGPRSCIIYFPLTLRADGVAAASRAFQAIFCPIVFDICMSISTPNCDSDLFVYSVITTSELQSFTDESNGIATRSISHLILSWDVLSGPVLPSTRPSLRNTAFL
ncbi:hypothetical protein NEOLEDRAFT_703269 [Neolentinus lepideus HHB14362 ss-1]|uniref:Secreted protein n=1 Tax=Neolentinus lepideus HHB14362 ss-1 TaxID=1314782 RepID=A0A165V4X0_9AGAM|nr:hypothetical protein NEOLEDRAFT_703269 [Neolentinus lepideus HHB14362 ss-1]